MNRLPVIGLIILGIGLVTLIATDFSGSVLGLGSGDFANLVYAGALITVIGGFVMSGRRFPSLLRGVGLWLLIGLVLVAGYQYRYELQDFASRISAGLLPGSPVTITDAEGRKSVILEKGPDGHFQARAVIAGQTLGLLIDTGATSTVLSYADAATAGIDVGRLAFTVPISTANGVARAAAARVSGIEVGDIVRPNQPVLVAADGSLEQSLLGMNFIATLSGFEIRGDRMILSD